MEKCKLVSVNKAKLSNGDELILPCTVNYYYITDNEQVEEAVKELLPITKDSKTMLAVDVETTGFDPYLNDIILLQIGTKDNIQYIFDIRKIDKTLLIPVLSGNYWKLGHNIKFDAKMIKSKFNIEFNKYYDTFIAEMVIRGGSFSTGNGGYSLDEIVKFRVGAELKLNTLGFNDQNLGSKTERAKKQMQESFLELGTNTPDLAQLAYAAQDVSGATIFKIVENQMEILLQENTNILYDPDAAYITDSSIKENYEAMFKPKLRLWETAKLEFKFLEVVADLELYGIPFDINKHKQVLENIEKDYKEYRLEFLKLLGKNTPQKTLLGTASINPDSSKQVLTALNFMKLKLEDTSAEDLEAKLRELDPKTEGYKIVEALLNYRTMSVLVKMFGDKLAARIHPITGRIHYNVKQVLETGRMATSEPNCFSEDTEILTDSGWKYFKDLQKTDLVAQFSKETETITFVKPLNYIKYPYNGDLLHIKSTQIDMLVTSDHRCLVKSRKNNKYKVVSAEKYPSSVLYTQPLYNRSCCSTINVKKIKTLYSGYVYCVEVPSSFIVVRRNQCALITGNCQQIPTKIPWKKSGDKSKDELIDNRDGLRECFSVKPGKSLVMYDYDSQELRVVASVSRDTNMLQAFKQNKNLHCYSATLMYDEEYEEFYKKYKSGDPVAKAKRTEAKTVSFGSLYGSGAPNLARVLNITIEKAKDILDRFWYAYPELKKAMTRYGELANKLGYSNTILGRRRYYDNLLEKIKWIKLDNSVASIETKAKDLGMEWLFEQEPTVTRQNIQKFKDAMIRKYSNNISRQSSNHVVQGSSADCTKLAAVNIRKEFKNLKLSALIVGLVHDEIIVECDEGIAQQCANIVESKMKEALSYFCPNVSATAEGKIANCWKK